MLLPDKIGRSNAKILLELAGILILYCVYCFL